MRRSGRTGTGLALGLRENWPQFSLLVLVNAFVGAMVGAERSVLPLLAEAEFGLASATATRRTARPPSATPPPSARRRPRPPPRRPRPS